MRVLSIGSMYPPHYLGGLELAWRAANAALRDAGHAVRVLASDFRLPAAGAAAEEPDVHRELRWYWRDHEFPPLGARERLALERHNRRVLARHLAGARPHAACLWGLGGMSLSLVEQLRRAGVPAVGVVCDDWMLYGPEVDAWTRMLARRPRAGALAERLSGVPARLELGRGARWLFISDHLRRRALARHDLPRTGLAHPGVDLDRFRPGERAHPWAWRLLYAGRIDPRKGIALAVRALAELPAQATLAVDGGGDERHLAELRALARDLGVERRVEFRRSPREQLPRAYAEADALVFPVVWEEPWGLVPLEAMACGTPVVATARGGSGEYLADGRNCLVFDPDAGPGALAGALRRLAGDPGLRGALRSGGLETARRHDERAFGEAVVRALEQEAGAARSGARAGVPAGSASEASGA